MRIRSKSVVTVFLMLLIANAFAASSTSDINSSRDFKAPRVQPIIPENMTPRQKEVLGIEEGKPLPKRAKINLHQTLMHNPELMAVYYPLGDVVARPKAFADKHRELVILRINWLYQDKWEWARHYINALKAGWTEADIEQIKVGPGSPHWSGLNRIFLQAADQLTKNAYLEDDVWEGLREHYSIEDILTFLTMVTHYHWVATVTRTFRIVPDRELVNFE